MIVQLRGTSGSGKSTAMKRIVETMGDWQAEFRTGRKKPLFYRSCSDWPETVVLGHYESPCGGCDTVGSAAAVYELVRDVRGKFPAAHVLCEGLLLSEDAKWTGILKGDGEDIRCVFLTTPVDRCLAQIRNRRAAAGNDKPLSEDNTRHRVAVIDRAREKLAAAGVLCRRASADQAAGLVLNWLRQAAR